MDEAGQGADGLTGWHVLAMFAGGFSVIIGVNLVLAYNAVRSFPGLETANSYVASQTFDAERAAQEALGWTAVLSADPNGLVLDLRDRTGAALREVEVTGLLGRATSAADDSRPGFVFDGAVWRAPVMLTRGSWTLHLNVIGPGGAIFRQRLLVSVPG